MLVIYSTAGEQRPPKAEQHGSVQSAACVVSNYELLVLLGTDVLEVTAKAQAHPAAPLHIVGPWLQLLLWLADARWRKLGAAAPVEQVQQVLDCLQGYVALLWTAAPPPPPSHDSSEQAIT